jgi:hypothetical protein
MDFVLSFLSIGALGLYVAIAVILLRRYLRTRDIGFVWLGFALVAWPLVSRLLGAGNEAMIDRIQHKQFVGVFPFSLIENGQISIGRFLAAEALSVQFIGVSLLLVAVIYISGAAKPQSVS